MYVTPTSLSAPEEIRRPFDQLAEALLKAADGREVIFLQNAGNYGDCLIRSGTVRFFEGHRPAVPRICQAGSHSARYTLALQINGWIGRLFLN